MLKKYNLYIPFLLFVLILTSSLVFAFNKNSNTEILNINGKSVGKQEFNMFLVNNKAVTLSYFYTNYGIENYNKDFWITPINNEIPIKVLVDKTINDIVRNKVEQQEAEKYGIIDSVTFDELIKMRNTVNKERVAAKARGEVIYGPIEYDINQYYSYYYGNVSLPLLTELRKEILIPTDEQLEEYYNKTKGPQYELPLSGKLVFYMINNEEIKFDENKLSEIFGFIRKEIEDKAGIQEINILIQEKYSVDLYCKTEDVDELDVGKEDVNYQNIINIMDSLNEGEISELINYNGYSGIFKVEEKSDTRIQTFEEVKDIVKDNFAGVMYEEYITNLSQKAEVKINPDIEQEAIDTMLN